MRTTIELRDDQRAALISLAARKGQKGFSAVIQEAIDQFLSEESERVKRTEAIRRLAGSVSKEEADRLRNCSQELRTSWR